MDRRVSTTNINTYILLTSHYPVPVVVPGSLGRHVTNRISNMGKGSIVMYYIIGDQRIDKTRMFIIIRQRLCCLSMKIPSIHEQQTAGAIGGKT